MKSSHIALPSPETRLQSEHQHNIYYYRPPPARLQFLLPSFFPSCRSMAQYIQPACRDQCNGCPSRDDGVASTSKEAASMAQAMQGIPSSVMKLQAMAIGKPPSYNCRQEQVMLILHAYNRICIVLHISNAKISIFFLFRISSHKMPAVSPVTSPCMLYLLPNSSDHACLPTHIQ